MSFQSLSHGTTDAQQQAAERHGAVLVLAGAGTGKTKTLALGVVHRIQHRHIPPSRILTVTFTNKAAQEMAGRIRTALGGESVPHWMGTFHGLGARQLRAEPEIGGLRPGFDILDADDTRRVVKRVMKGMNLRGSDGGTGVDRDPIKTMCNRLSKLKDSLITPDEASAHIEAKIAVQHAAGAVDDPDGWRAAARVYAEYQRTLRDGNAADFGDLLLWPTKAMLTNTVYRDRWAERFDCLLADEYQDVNQAQYTWLRLFGARHGEVFVVGDDDQSVFGWRSADVGFIRRFAQDFPGATQIRLEENFRSTGHILAAANAVISRDPKRLGKTLFTSKAVGDPVEVIGFRNAEDEARGIVTEIIRRHAQGVTWEAMAVLYRGNALSRGFEEALMRGRVPYVLIGDVGFYQRAEIKDALALLRILSTPDSVQADEAFRRVINVPARGFGAKALDELEQEAAFRQLPLLRALETADLPPRARAAGLAFVDAIAAVGRDQAATVADQVSLLLEATGYRAMLRESRAESTEGRLENLQELILLAGSFHSARELLDHAALSSTGPKEEGAADRVKLMTLHRSKGLEFGHVFLPAWEQGVFPPEYGDADEERRLAYVAITRGMRRVTISHCEFRRGYNPPSRFLADIPAAHRRFGWIDAQLTTQATTPKRPTYRSDALDAALAQVRRL